LLAALNLIEGGRSSSHPCHGLLKDISA